MTISLKAWLSKATPKQKTRLAADAQTSVKTIEQIASGFRGGSADAAVRIAKAAGGEIDQASICAACGRCPHYKAARR